MKFFALFVAIFTVIHYLTDRRIGSGYFYQVQPGAFRIGQGFFQCNDTQLLSFFADYPNGGRLYFSIDS
jgi:hypothetical protein